MNRFISTNNSTAASIFYFWGIPLSISILYIVLAAVPDVKLAVPLLTAVTSIQVILIAAVLFFGEKGSLHWPPWFILVFAVLYRLIFLFQEPQLSDDIYRYLWDGLQSLSGNNPYALPPDIAPASTRILALLRQKVNHPELMTIYPPASQIVFAAGTLLGKSLLSLKALIVLADLLTCFVMIRLLIALKMKPFRAVLYAWHPLPVIEIASSGHVDGIGFLFLVSAMLLLFRQPRSLILRTAAGFLFSFSVLIKFFPLVFLPGLLLPGHLRDRVAFLSGFFAGILALSLPFMPELTNSFSTLNTYLYNWEFSGFAFRSLREITATPEMPRKILLSLFVLAAGSVYFRLFYHAGFYSKTGDKPELPTRLLNAFYAISFTFLLLTPTLHPWYALGLVCFLPFSAGPAGLVFAWSVFLGYRVLIPYTILGEWTENTATAFMIWIAPVIAFFASHLANNTIHLLPGTKHIDHR
jgi:hypothetical protein